MTKLALVALFVAGAGCSSNDKFCEGNPHNNCNLMWDAPPGECTTSAQCSAATPVCDLASMACVQCTTQEATACSGTTPVCGDDKMCRGCTAHSDCVTSDVCNFETGACVVETDVAYVEAGKTGNCDKATPCGTMTEGLAKNRAFVKIKGALNEADTTTITGAVTIFAAAGASINTSTDDVPVIAISQSNADVAIYDLKVTGGTMSGGVGINLPTGGTPKLRLMRARIEANAGGGVSAFAGTLTVTRSVIVGNSGGGISISSAQFDLTNNFIVQNGGPTSLIGGIDIASSSGTGSHRLDFNTIAANAGTSTVNSGINCGTVGAPIVFSNNIVYANLVSGGGKQIGGSTNCSSTYSDVGEATTGTGNINLDPKFANAVQGDFHVLTTSPCKDAADPAATLDVDVDGDARPEGTARDVGADEFTP